MDWFVVDKKYINYLTQFDSRVGYAEYGERLKLHVGILLTIGDFHYYVPIFSAKPTMFTFSRKKKHSAKQSPEIIPEVHCQAGFFPCCKML